MCTCRPSLGRTQASGRRFARLSTDVETLVVVCVRRHPVVDVLIGSMCDVNVVLICQLCYCVQYNTNLMSSSHFNTQLRSCHELEFKASLKIRPPEVTKCKLDEHFHLQKCFFYSLLTNVVLIIPACRKRHVTTCSYRCTFCV